MSLRVSKWNDMRVRVGWTIRLRNGLLARVEWKADNGESYMANVLNPQPTEQEQSSELASS